MPVFWSDVCLIYVDLEASIPGFGVSSLTSEDHVHNHILEVYKNMNAINYLSALL